MKKLFVSVAIAATMFAGASAPVAVAQTAPTAQLQSVQTIYGYRCWTYDTAGYYWAGWHSSLPRARQLAMAACRQNRGYAAVCYHVQGPCEKGYF